MVLNHVVHHYPSNLYCCKRMMQSHELRCLGQMVHHNQNSVLRVGFRKATNEIHREICLNILRNREIKSSAGGEDGIPS